MGGKWCGKQCFLLFGKRRKKERTENSEENFPPGPPIFFLPNREENCGEKTFSLCNYWTALSLRLQIHQQHTHIHQQHTHIKPRKSTDTHVHQTHIQIHINNKSKIEKKKKEKKKKERKKKIPKSPFSPPKNFAFSAQNHCP